MRDWDDLTEPEFSKEMADKFIEMEETEEDKLETHLTFDSFGGNEEHLNSIKENVEEKINDFTAGGCMPESDKEIKCKFNLGTVQGVGGRSSTGRERPRGTFSDAMLIIEDADQAKSPSSRIGEVKSGVAIVSGGDFVFCESNGEELVCDRFEKPEGVLNLKMMTDKGIVTGKNKLKELESKETVKTDSIKFPMGGKVNPNKKRDMIEVSL